MQIEIPFRSAVSEFRIWISEISQIELTVKRPTIRLFNTAHATDFRLFRFLDCINLIRRKYSSSS